ncbi:MAG TPA: PilX N-terminal domain-containing pilus assembly protein, partial [Oleiagrimonas sp.]|nr:PilX N-terminal domain-containing pilus assembly protein [Oleiagrimonas sp.]
MNQHVGWALPAIELSQRRAMPTLQGTSRLPRAQRGVALVVALILLVVITLVGLAAVGGTIMQNKMASNQYDREVAFQSAESALRIVEGRIVSNPGDIARNCQSGGTTCLDNPFEDTGLPSGSIHTLPTSAYAAQNNATGQPQYVIESMGHWINFSS